MRLPLELTDLHVDKKKLELEWLSRRTHIKNTLFCLLKQLQVALRNTCVTSNKYLKYIGDAGKQNKTKQ